MILAPDGGGSAPQKKKAKVLGASSRKPAPRVQQHGGNGDTRSDSIGARNTGRGAVKMPEILSGVHEAAYRLYMQSQPRPGDKAQQKKAKAAQKALRDLFNT